MLCRNSSTLSELVEGEIVIIINESKKYKTIESEKLPESKSMHL